MKMRLKKIINDNRELSRNLKINNNISGRPRDRVKIDRHDKRDFHKSAPPRFRSKKSVYSVQIHNFVHKFSPEQ